MESKELQELTHQAEKMLASSTLDNEMYQHIENFILKNNSRLSANEGYQHLKSIMAEIALKHNLKDITEAQENFGLNSCAQ